MKPNFLINPVHRKRLLMLVLFFPLVFLGAEFAEQYGFPVVLGMIVGAIPGWSVALFYGKCQHCGAKLKLLALNADDFSPKQCHSCHMKYDDAATT
jgi:hypothetical protein